MENLIQLFFETILKDQLLDDTEIQSLQKKFIDEGISNLTDLRELGEADLEELVPSKSTRNRIKKGIKIILGEFELDQSLSDFWGEEKFNSEQASKEVFQKLVQIVTNKKISSVTQILAKEIKEIQTLGEILKESQICKDILFREIETNAVGWGNQAFKDSLKVNIRVTVGIAVMESVMAVQAFMKGDITGKECAKSITQSFIGGAGSLTGSYGGAIAGAYVGSMFGPVAGIIGYLVGVGVGGLTGYLFGSLINEFIWGLFEESKDDEAREALIKAAFKNLHATEKDSWVTIAKNYRTLALACHPDKFPTAPEETKTELKHKFCQLNESYHILKDFYLKSNKIVSEEVQDIQKVLQIEFEE